MENIWQFIRDNWLSNRDFKSYDDIVALCLPSYSPDFNPIEQAFAKLKALLRMAAARSVDDLWAAIAESIDPCAPAECANFFANSGYGPH